MSPLNVETGGETISAGDETFKASHVDVIETVIASLDQGGDAMVSRDEDGYLWKFTYGSVAVYVQLTGTDDEDTLTVWSPLLKLPCQSAAAARKHAKTEFGLEFAHLVTDRSLAQVQFVRRRAVAANDGGA